MLATEGAKAPDVPEQLLLLEHALGILGQRDQQLVLLRRELHRLAPDAYDSRREVDLEIAHGEPRVPRPVRAPQHGAHAREELVVDERLGHRFIRRRAFRSDPMLVLNDLSAADPAE
jgi:hypothetical protein